MDEAPKDTRMPRGVLAVVAIGLLACIAAALLTTDKYSGEAANLEWVQAGDIPDSKPVTVPGATQKMQLVEGRMRASGTNVSGYSLFQVATKLRIDAGAPIGGARIVCSVHGGRGSEIAQSSGGLRATYPRSSEDGIYGQEVPEVVLLDFSSHGTELAVLEVLEEPARFTTAQGVKLEWPAYEPRTEHLKYFLTDKPESTFELPFFTVWKSTAVPKAQTSCTLETSAGKATVHNAGSLPKASPPIDEEAEEEKEEEKEEAEEKAEEREED
jgi:outer membrane lipoprotein SlyB